MCSDRRRKIVVLLLLLAVLTLHVFIRYNTFWLSHVLGDQIQYIGLAMKLEHFGFNGYTLRGIDYGYADEDKHFSMVMPSEDREGMMIRDLKRAGIGYYDIPFFHKGPAFPMALMLSHRMFSTDKRFLSVARHIGKLVFHIKPRLFFTTQFYAAVVPFAFSAVLMLITFALGRILFSDRVGLYAAFMMAVNPVSILTSYKLWADDMLAVFVALAVLLYLLAVRNNTVWLAFLAGISGGIAVLTKQNGGIIFVALFAYTLWLNRSCMKTVRTWPRLIIDRRLIAFGLGLVFLSAPWFYKIYRVYGDPLYLPIAADILETDKSGWFQMLRSRPHPLVLFGIGIPAISPLFAFAYGTLKHCVQGIVRGLRDNDRHDNHVILLWIWIIAFALFFILWSGGKEHRRMLPAYPAIAILSAYALTRLKLCLEAVSKNRLLSELLLAAVLIASASWSIPLGLFTALENDALILKPF
jgi:hypothetical protein